jgi:hypothetical protein
VLPPPLALSERLLEGSSERTAAAQRGGSFVRRFFRDVPRTHVAGGSAVLKKATANHRTLSFMPNDLALRVLDSHEAA